MRSSFLVTMMIALPVSIYITANRYHNQITTMKTMCCPDRNWSFLGDALRLQLKTDYSQHQEMRGDVLTPLIQDTAKKICINTWK